MDQIILEIPSKYFHVLNTRAFEPEYYPIRPGFFEYKKYLSKLHPKGYYPQISIHGRPNKKLGYQYILKIQVSVPKLLYGNNLVSVNLEDEDRFYHILKAKCWDLGVEILASPKNIKVIGFDPSINIYLTGGSTSDQAIRYLYKAYTSKNISFDKRDFRDKGHAIYLHTGKWNFVVYDKKEDLMKPKYKRIDKLGGKDLQLFAKLKNKEVLRLELHGRDQAKLLKLFQRFYPGIDEVTCGMLFNEKIWKTILRESFLNGFLEGNRLAFSFEDNPMTWYERIKHKYPKLTDLQIRAKLALVLLAKDNEGLKVYRRKYEKQYSQRQWYRLMAEIKELQTLVLPNDYFSFIHDIDKALWYKDCIDLIDK